MPKHRDPYAKVNEILGHYNPRKQPRELVLKADRIKHWIDCGAEVTNTVWNLLIDEKLVEGKKRGVTHLSKKRVGKLEAKEVEKKEKEVVAKAKAEAAAQAAKEEAEAAAQAAKEAESVPEAPVEETLVEEKTAEDVPVTEEQPAE
ncbi:MAG: 30S ribosomal protein S16 [Candidatus Uhrbacteria bacterium GW2011_GWE2_40_58]|nr:MAG: 30S ribosomal protein S16 [Candidatus Uhrbacteria bacterium GW2011_GWE2_40_58]